MAAAIFWESHVCCGFNMKYRRFGLCQAKDVLEYFLNLHYSVMCVNSINTLWLKHDAKMQSFAYWVFHWDHRPMAMAPKGGGFSIWKSIHDISFNFLGYVYIYISVREVRKSTFFFASIFLLGFILFIYFGLIWTKFVKKIAPVCYSSNVVSVEFCPCWAHRLEQLGEPNSTPINRSGFSQ